MIININSFINGLNFVKPVIEITGNPKAMILLHFDNSEMEIRYNDNKAAIATRVPIEASADEYKEDIVVDYKKLLDSLSLCASGQLKISDGNVTISEENHKMLISVVKSFEFVVDDEVVSKPISKFEQEVIWFEPNASMKYTMLTRMDYSQLFNTDGETWNKDTLKNILNKLAIEPTKPVSISAQSSMAFVNTFTFAAVIPLENVVNNPIIQFKAAKALSAIMPKLECSDMIISKTDDGNFITVTDGQTVGIQFQNGSVSKTDLSIIQQYGEKAYSSYQLKFIREALVNIIDAVTATDKLNAQTIKFEENEDGEIVMVFNSGSDEKKNKYSVAVAGKVANKEEVLDLELNISINIIKGMLAMCEHNYITFYIDAGEKNSLRIGDLDEEKTTGPDNIVHSIEAYTTLGSAK